MEVELGFDVLELSRNSPVVVLVEFHRKGGVLCKFWAEQLVLGVTAMFVAV